MKTVIVTPQIPIAFQCGGIGAYVWHFSRLLREAGQDVHIIFTQTEQRPPKEWLPPFEQLGITVTSLRPYAKVLDVPCGYSLQTKVAELAADAIPSDASVVYFADWEGNGFHFVRRRRFSQNKLPVAVTVLHGCSAWDRQGMGCWPAGREDMAQDFRESYVARYSDFVVSPSHYMLGWARNNQWILPAEERTRVLGCPFLPDPRLLAGEASLPDSFERLIFYGRLDTRKGIDLFVNALIGLRGKPCLHSLKEVVLLGSRGHNSYGEPADIARLLDTELGDGIAVEARTNLDSFEAQAYLTAHRQNSLVVMPSRLENLAYSAIEASLIPDLNLICASTGALPEVVGARGRVQLFEPHLAPLTNKLEEWLLSGPRPASQMGGYDWQAANHKWLAFHDEVCEHATSVRLKQVQQNVIPSITVRTSCEHPCADVCIPYYNLGAYLPYALESLAQQTTRDFNVFVVNDGSTDPSSVQVFEEMRQQYQRKNWQFVSTENQGLSAARNLAASLGSAEYLCFVDADNIATPHMIERFIEAIQHSEDACLTCYNYVFEGEGRHCASSGLLKPALFQYVPVGNCLALGILENPFGDANCIIRRAVFEALGGFTTDVSLFITGEDRELFARLSLAGYTMDVIPEFLFFYRFRKNSMLQITDPFLNDGRVVRHYEERLRQIGLEDLAPLALGLRYYAEEASEQQKTHFAVWNAQKNQIDQQQEVIERLNTRLAELKTLEDDRTALLQYQQACMAVLEAEIATMSERLPANRVRSLRERLLPIGSQRYEVYKGFRQGMRWLRRIKIA